MKNGECVEIIVGDPHCSDPKYNGKCKICKEHYELDPDFRCIPSIPLPNNCT